MRYRWPRCIRKQGRGAGARRRGRRCPSDMLTGRNGRYWMAERRRWEEGLELEQKDFSAYIAYVEEHLDPGI